MTIAYTKLNNDEREKREWKNRVLGLFAVCRVIILLINKWQFLSLVIVLVACCSLMLACLQSICNSIHTRSWHTYTHTERTRAARVAYKQTSWLACLLLLGNSRRMYERSLVQYVVQIEFLSLHFFRVHSDIGCYCCCCCYWCYSRHHDAYPHPIPVFLFVKNITYASSCCCYCWYCQPVRERGKVHSLNNLFRLLWY